MEFLSFKSGLPCKFSTQCFVSNSLGKDDEKESLSSFLSFPLFSLFGGGVCANPCLDLVPLCLVSLRSKPSFFFISGTAGNGPLQFFGNEVGSDDRAF